MKLKFPTQKDAKRYHCKSSEVKEIRFTRLAALKVWWEYQKDFWDPFLYGCGEVCTKGYFHNIKLLSFLLSLFHESSVEFYKGCKVCYITTECRNIQENVTISY